MFENLSDRLERSFKILKGEGKITEINVAETLKDVPKCGPLDAIVKPLAVAICTSDVHTHKDKEEAVGEYKARKYIKK